MKIKKILFLTLFLCNLVVILSFAENSKTNWQNEKERQELFERYRKDGGKRIDWIKVLLFNPDDEKRLKTVIKLFGGLKGEYERDTIALPQFIFALENDPYSKVRYYIAHFFGLWRDPQTIAPLVRTLNDEDEWVRYIAASRLVSQRKEKDKAFKVLRELLFSSQIEDVRISSAGDIFHNDPFGRQYLFKALMTDKSPKVRESICHVLMYREDTKTGYHKVYTGNEVLNDISTVICLDIIKDAEYAPRYSFGMLASLSDYLVGSEFVIEGLKEAIRNHENINDDERKKRWRKRYIKKMEKLLNELEKGRK